MQVDLSRNKCFDASFFFLDLVILYRKWQQVLYLLVTCKASVLVRVVFVSIVFHKSNFFLLVTIDGYDPLVNDDH